MRLGGKGVAEKKFDTLAEAVQAASDGDTIEIRGNGPFITKPIHLGTTALTIRAGEGFRPVIKLSPEWAEQNVHLLDTQAALVLEGLELHRVRPAQDEKSYHHVVESTGAPVRAANCRFVLKPGSFAVQATDSPLLDLRNCEFLLGAGGNPVHNYAVVWNAPAGGRCRMQNCLTAGHFGFRLGSESYPPKPASVVLAGNTLVARQAPVLLFLDPAQEPPGGGAAGGFSIEASTNVFDGANVCLGSYYIHPGDPPPTEAVFLRRSLSWKGDRNQFSPGSAFTNWAYPGTSGYGIKDLTEWNRFWKQENSGCGSGKVRYRGGDVLSRADLSPGAVDAGRLPPPPGQPRLPRRQGRQGPRRRRGPGRPRPGLRALEEDAGVSAVAQGHEAAHERKLPQPEPSAFVLLGGKGVAERKFDTLAEAVQGASDGDTIEVRGNGPFVSQPVNFGKRGLTIRAATGFRPVIKGNADRIAEVGNVPYLVHSQGPLVLEGLELHMTGPAEFRNCVLGPWPLCDVANCRFVLNGSSLPSGPPMRPSVQFATVNSSARRAVTAKSTSSGTWRTTEKWRWRTTCSWLLASPWSRTYLATLRPAQRYHPLEAQHGGDAPRCDCSGLMSIPESAEPGAAPDRQPVQMHVSANLFEPIEPTGCAFSLLLPPDWYRQGCHAAVGKEAERLLPRLVAWREERNLYWQRPDLPVDEAVKGPIGPEQVFSTSHCRLIKRWPTGNGCGRQDEAVRCKNGPV